MGVTIEYLRYHWGTWYSFAVRSGQFTATAKFGTGDVLTAETAECLRQQIWRHYPGSSAEMSST
jgi:hypothetical protein